MRKLNDALYMYTLVSPHNNPNSTDTGIDHPLAADMEIRHFIGGLGKLPFCLHQLSAECYFSVLIGGRLLISYHSEIVY